MLIWFVVLYLVVSIGIGLYAATRVHNTRDFVVAGRTLPLYVVTATVFATWFGSETVLGISARFVQEGLGGIIEDPFGSSMCLILVGLFFAAKLYRMDLLTIGDYYRLRYNPAVELLTAIAIVLSYLGWVSAQIVALGVVFEVLTQGAMSQDTGIMVGAAIVLIYTFYGGMFSVAWTNFFQMVIIIFGIIYIAFIIGEKAGGVANVVSHAAAAGKFNFLPELTLRDMLWFLGAWVTMMFGSIPQQDVFQRVTSARTEKIAVAGSVMGGSFYFLFAFLPLFMAYAAIIIDPVMTQQMLEKDPQHILPNLVIAHTPLFAQIMFFGALLAAIMSTAAGTLLAPSVTFTENILKNFLKKELSDRQFLWTMRAVVAIFTAGVTVFALNSDSSIYEMVGSAYKVTLVTAFIPLVCGLYWKPATTQGALLSIFAGLISWLAMEYWNPEGLMPPQLLGLFAAVAGMLMGSLMPQLIGHRQPAHHAHPGLHHQAAAQTHHVAQSSHPHPPSHSG